MGRVVKPQPQPQSEPLPTTLAVLHPASRGMVHTFLLNTGERNLFLTDKPESVAMAMLSGEISEVLLDTMLLFEEEFSALRWIMFVNPKLNIRFLN